MILLKFGVLTSHIEMSLQAKQLCVWVFSSFGVIAKSNFKIFDLEYEAQVRWWLDWTILDNPYGIRISHASAPAFPHRGVSASFFSAPGVSTPCACTPASSRVKLLLYIWTTRTKVVRRGMTWQITERTHLRTCVCPTCWCNLCDRPAPAAARRER